MSVFQILHGALHVIFKPFTLLIELKWSLIWIGPYVFFFLIKGKECMQDKEKWKVQ